MGIEGIKRIFQERVSRIGRLKKIVRNEQQEKVRIENEMLHFERIIRNLEIKMKRASARISVLKEKDRRTEKQLERHKEEINKILAEIDAVRKSIG